MTSDGDDDAPEPLEPADDATRTHAGRSDETVTHLPGLLGWVHSGFSVHGEQTVPTEDVQGAERLARYLTRGPLPIDVVERVEGGRAGKPVS